LERGGHSSRNKIDRNLKILEVRGVHLTFEMT
jgi:hypothetical protein